MVTIEEQVNRRTDLLNDYCNIYCRANEPDRTEFEGLKLYKERALANADEIAAKGNPTQSDIAFLFISNCSSSGHCLQAKSNIESLIRVKTTKKD